MPSVREFLLRLRPAGAPDSAGAAGVPADANARAAQAQQDVSRFLQRAGEQAAEVEREANGLRVERVALVIGRVRQQLSGLDGR